MELSWGLGGNFPNKGVELGQFADLGGQFASKRE